MADALALVAIDGAQCALLCCDDRENRLMTTKSGRKLRPDRCPVTGPVKPLPESDDEIDERDLLDESAGAEDRSTWNLGDGTRWVRPSRGEDGE